MPVETPSLFAKVIQDHLELRQRNADLERQLPLDGYRNGDPFENHPLFKTEEQARLEETMGGDEQFAVEEWALARDFEQVEAHVPESDGDSLWTRSRDFDWGD